MPSEAHPAHPPADIHLPEVFAIGFTGHRTLPNEAPVRAAIHHALAAELAIPNRTVYAVSSVAAGADLLFAETCLELSIPLQVLLPFSANEFRNDFDPADWARAESVIAAALSVTVLGNEDSRTERYYECGIETVQQSHLLLAVWNGEPARGLGGTQQILDFASSMGHPVLWIHAGTALTRSIAPTTQRKLDDTGELHFLNQLPTLSTPPELDLPNAWLAKLDLNSLQVAPQVRRLAAIPILFTALAALVSASASSHATTNAVWSGLGAGLGIGAAFLPRLLALKKRQALWVRIRTAAEVTRSILALWDSPIRYQLIGQEVLPEFAPMVQSLNLLKVQAHRSQTQDLTTFTRRYLDERVHDQMSYFAGQVRKAGKKAAVFRRVSKYAGTSASAFSVWTFVTHLLHPALSGGVWLALLTAILFQAATVAGALLVVHDCDRRQRRYQQLHDSLATLELELSAFRTWPPILQVVSKVESALIVELLEWRSLLQNTKMPRK